MNIRLISTLLACGLWLGGIMPAQAVGDDEQKAKMQAENIVQTAERYKNSMKEHETKLNEIIKQLSKLEQDMTALEGKDNALKEMKELAKQTNALQKSAEDTYENAREADQKHLKNNKALWDKIVSTVDKKNPPKSIINAKKTANSTIKEAETIFSGLRNLDDVSHSIYFRIFAIYEKQQKASGVGGEQPKKADEAEDNSAAKKLLELENYFSNTSKTLKQQVEAVQQIKTNLSNLMVLKQYQKPGYPKNSKEAETQAGVEIWETAKLNEGMNKVKAEKENLSTTYKATKSLIEEMLNKLSENPKNFANNITFLQEQQKSLKTLYKDTKQPYEEFFKKAKSIVKSNGTEWIE